MVVKGVHHVPGFPYSFFFPQVTDVKTREEKYFGDFQQIRDFKNEKRFIGPGVHLSYFMNCASLIMKHLQNADWQGCVPSEFFYSTSADDQKICTVVFFNPQTRMENEESFKVS